MTPTQARTLAKLLTDAADKAELDGVEQVDLMSGLLASDDAARAELEAAIQSASSQIDN